MQAAARISRRSTRLQSRLVLEKKETEITALFAYLAGVLMLLATALSLW
jgi:Ca-activated chloride channel family protein